MGVQAKMGWLVTVYGHQSPWHQSIFVTGSQTSLKVHHGSGFVNSLEHDKLNVFWLESLGGTVVNWER